MLENPWTNLHTKVHKSLHQRQLLPTRVKVLVAISGGQDSLCLGKLLLDLSSKWHWQLEIAHCDHQWPTDAGMAEHVAQVAATWQLPFHLRQAEQLKETEAAARKWRYEALVKIAQGIDCAYIVTGHTKSDRAETLLYNLVRGCGGDGLAALQWNRELTSEITLIRPLLEVYRAETREFCRRFALPIWFDVVNQDKRFARNRIRQELIPYLQEQFNPQVEGNLAQTAELLRAEGELLDAMAQDLRQQAQVPGKLRLNRQCLQPAPLALQRRVIRQFLPQVMTKLPNFEQIEAVVNLITAPNRSRTSTLPGGMLAEVAGQWIVFHSASGL